MDVCKMLGFAVWLLGQGPVISLIVQGLKRIPWVQSHPRETVAALNLAASLAAGVVYCGLDLQNLLLQVATGIAGSVATYELFLKPVAKALTGSSEEPPRLDER
uniref:Uncharacterized protein n=1 Tax=Meiothermus ruber TaxID=277 RepID=A0A7C3HC48_MEIRU